MRVIKLGRISAEPVKVRSHTITGVVVAPQTAQATKAKEKLDTISIATSRVVGLPTKASRGRC